MRCLVVADLHYSLPQFDWLVNAAAHFDVVVIAGDALDIGSVVDFRAQIVVVKKYLEILSGVTRVILCSGNHDLDERDEAGEKYARWVGDVSSLGILRDGESVTLGDTVFTICPWWDGPRVKEKIGKQLEAAASASHQGRWIWVHHAPAAKSPTSWGGQRYFGDAELVDWINSYKPDLVLSGHVHQSPFIPDGSWFDRINETWVFNVGHQFGSPPAHIMLDLDHDKAYWLSSAGEEFIDLSMPMQRPAKQVEQFPDWLIALSAKVSGQAAAPAGDPNPASHLTPTG